MPSLRRIPWSLKTARSSFIPGLLLPVGLLGQSSSQAQDVVGQTTPVSLAGMSPNFSNASALPDASDAVASDGATDRNKQAVSAYSGHQTSGGFSSFPNLRQRERSFLMDIVGPTGFIAPAFEAGIDTARPLKVGYPPNGAMAPGDHPAHGDLPEWGEGAQGYAKRYADRFGQGLVGATSRYAFGELLREDVTYHRCECTGLLPRTAHALVGAYTAYTQSGRAVPSLPAVASPFIASEVAVAAWYPARYDASDALRVSVLNYVATPFKNLFAEFIKR